MVAKRTTYAAQASKSGGRLGLLAAFIAGEAYSIYATFFAHALTPVAVYVIDRSTHRRLLPGQIGDIEDVFHWDGLASILVFSLVVATLTWCAMRVTAKYARRLTTQTVSRPEEIHAYPTARAIAGNRTVIA